MSTNFYLRNSDYNKLSMYFIKINWINKQCKTNISKLVDVDYVGLMYNDHNARQASHII